MTKVVALTKPGSSYPGYVNVTKSDDGGVVVTLRSDPDPDGREGKTATLVLDAHQWRDLRSGLAVL